MSCIYVDTRRQFATENNWLRCTFSSMLSHHKSCDVSTPPIPWRGGTVYTVLGQSLISVRS